MIPVFKYLTVKSGKEEMPHNSTDVIRGWDAGGGVCDQYHGSVQYSIVFYSRDTALWLKKTKQHVTLCESIFYNLDLGVQNKEHISMCTCKKKNKRTNTQKTL